MSMRPEPIGPVPEDTARVVRDAFPKGNPFMHMRDAFGVIYGERTSRSSSRCAEGPPSRLGGWLW